MFKLTLEFLDGVIFPTLFTRSNVHLNIFIENTNHSNTIH